MPGDRVAIAFANILRQTKPQAFVWENVPGVLGSNSGRDFATFLHAVSQCGYGIGVCLTFVASEFPKDAEDCSLSGFLTTNDARPSPF